MEGHSFLVSYASGGRLVGYTPAEFAVWDAGAAGGAAVSMHSIGRRMKNVVPWPTSLSKVSEPWWRSMTARAMART
jgi:hypothetical protein